jgi:hypothetical protein
MNGMSVGAGPGYLSNMQLSYYGGAGIGLNPGKVIMLNNL